MKLRYHHQFYQHLVASFSGPLNSDGWIVKLCAGCSALHCAVDTHDRIIHDSKIDSRRTIFQLISRGANIAVQVDLPIWQL